MSNIIQFPLSPDQGWGQIEKGIRTSLRELGATVEMENTICARMQEVYEKISIDLSVPLESPLPEELSDEARAEVEAILERDTRALIERVDQLVHDIFFERLALELELYELTHRDG